MDHAKIISVSYTKKKALERSKPSRAVTPYKTSVHDILRHIIFFHPDYTVGLGVSPNHALRLVGYTTGRDLHPALKIVFD